MSKKVFYFNLQGKVFGSLKEISELEGKKVKNAADAEKLGYDSTEADSLEDAQAFVDEAISLLGDAADPAQSQDGAEGSDTQDQKEDDSKEDDSSNKADEKSKGKQKSGKDAGKTADKSKPNKEEGKQKSGKDAGKTADKSKPVKFQTSFKDVEELSAYMKGLETEQQGSFLASLGIEFSSTGKENVDRMLAGKKARSHFFPSEKSSRVTPWAVFSVDELKKIAKKNKVVYMEVNHPGIQQMRIIEALNRAQVEVPTRK